MARDKKLIIGNWKMNLGVHDASLYLHKLSSAVKIHRNVEVVIAPTMLALQTLSLQINHRQFKLAAQNFYWRDHGAFTGTKLRGLCEAQGMVLESDGTFKYYQDTADEKTQNGTDAKAVSFVMFNRDNYPFNPEMLRTNVIKAVTFQLDIPHVMHCTEAFNHMVQVARQMEIGLHAVLVDDNNRPLGDMQIEKIRQQLKEIIRLS